MIWLVALVRGRSICRAQGLLSSQSVDMDIQEWTGFLPGFAENYTAAPRANWQSFDLGVLAVENHTVNCMAVVLSGSVPLPESE